MAENRSEDSSFPSKYSPSKWVTPAQYIIELVCENSAKYYGRDLPVRFWRIEEWSKFFSSQTRAVNRLLKKYEYKAIISAVKSKNIRSLLPKWVENVIAEEQNKLNSKRASVEKNTDGQKQRKPRIINKQKTDFKSKKSINKLLALDEEIENG
ncbi:hypothetical protein DRO61_01875 [Candidatus Bathyarchaeota archaeon]|nr:MAG: hypothetical protein DRO61_01875 [Candidatus Bathyarchaeota archaeon]